MEESWYESVVPYADRLLFLLLLDEPLADRSQVELLKSGLMQEALTATMPTNWQQKVNYLLDLGKDRGSCSYRFANRPNRARVDPVDVLERKEASEQSGSHDEDARTKQQRDEKFATTHQSWTQATRKRDLPAQGDLHFPQQWDRNAQNHKVGASNSQL